MTIKEYGSDFHNFSDFTASNTSLFDDEKFSLFFSGRVAIYNLLKFGIDKYQWKKVGFPSYYCHEVIDYCKNLDIEVVYYQHNPLSNSKIIEWDDEEKNVFVSVDFFGVSKLDTRFLKKSIVIDDLTHNILGFTESTADFCFASLRKQIPIAVGGFCLSKDKELSFEVGETELANETAIQKLIGMYLKSLYLDGVLRQKEIFREVLSKAEKNLSSTRTNSKLPYFIRSLLFSLDVEHLVRVTRKNCHYLQSKLASTESFEILRSKTGNEQGLIMICKSMQVRDTIREHLINRQIYPAIIWPEQTEPLDIALENTMLFVHCDFRYDTKDIEYISNTLNEVIKYV